MKPAVNLQVHQPIRLICRPWGNPPNVGLAAVWLQKDAKGDVADMVIGCCSASFGHHEQRPGLPKVGL